MLKNAGVVDEIRVLPKELLAEHSITMEIDFLFKQIVQGWNKAPEGKVLIYARHIMNAFSKPRLARMLGLVVAFYL